MPGSYWECSECGALNKAFAALCFTCGGATRKPGPAARHEIERVHLTRGARAMLAAALLLSALVGFALVRTFRTPVLESRAGEEDAANAGREPVPPGATMPGAPDSGWLATPPSTTPSSPPASPVRVIAPTPVRPIGPPRALTVTDPRSYLAAQGARAATRDPAYLLALRQWRVHDLRRRLAEARSSDERAKLQAWLDGALADLQHAR